MTYDSILSSGEIKGKTCLLELRSTVPQTCQSFEVICLWLCAHVDSTQSRLEATMLTLPDNLVKMRLSHHQLRRIFTQMGGSGDEIQMSGEVIKINYKLLREVFLM